MHAHSLTHTQDDTHTRYLGITQIQGNTAKNVNKYHE